MSPNSSLCLTREDYSEYPHVSLNVVSNLGGWPGFKMQHMDAVLKKAAFCLEASFLGCEAECAVKGQYL